ncbi:bifunctional peptidase and arginyl-hydroxylase JMJD5 [Ischnura elegans]|uniref:bifunctional peptidase and arginyl-hydroxylase JMJD5 n=1 Tax=Ischnura elegans TaxID=197161 RepID=UPI001ED8B4FF|nr:bifunctional peptidase and arginyl-hydroxylase JMJD5 [Ischnura elegans]
MDCANLLLTLVVGENGVSKNWESRDGLKEISSKELCSVSGEIYLLKSLESLLLELYGKCNEERLNLKLKDGLKRCQSVLDSIWERLNTGIWKQTPTYLRHLYSYASLIKAVVLSCLSCHGDSSKERLEYLRASLKTVDYGILLGMPTLELTTAAQILSKELNKCSSREDLCPSFGQMTKKGKVTADNIKDPHPGIADEVSVEDVTVLDCPPECPWRAWGRPTRSMPVLLKPSLQQFYIEHFLQGVPAVLKGCLDHWPALSLWSPSYLTEMAGNRTVPIELGPHYVHPAWGQKLMAIGDFVEQHMAPDPKQSAGGIEKKIGYLAQHPLFDQIPELRNDIKVPEYCCLTEDIDSSADEEVDINAWFGPKGTVSPLHHDPKHNLLAQVLGSKRVILYSSDDSKYLHPYEGQLLDNTSQVDPEDPLTLSRFPDVSSAQSWECELHAGDMLYIPRRWWHHVRSLSTSFSVSFWW